MKRSEVKEQYKWKLSDMYATVEAWDADYAFVEQKLSEVVAFNGNLTTKELRQAVEGLHRKGIGDGNLKRVAIIANGQEAHAASQLALHAGNDFRVNLEGGQIHILHG